MLGEGARTTADAERYVKGYAAAIDAIGQHAAGAGPQIPRHFGEALGAAPALRSAAGDRVWAELVPRVLAAR